ncbi:hypothetical protein H8B09_02785 [Paenibacillus sp. PR3]|uniref:Glycosyltransferase n=1 Tax=Paenibacillus terricola TaxID=2763503 RepID=A0ABR8MNS5_9BACL|nr:hypothetical protein [Paenibacillus terricola]MBD3917664.1 hypothetical protein [Paenibacillus terricola]
MIVGTVVTRSHLARAKLLAQSIKRFNPEVKVVVSLLERYNQQDISMYPHFDEVVLASQTWSGNFNQAIFKYSAQEEASCFAGALLIDYMFHRYPNENQVVLLDCDMEVLAPLQDLESRLARCSILLTPRRLSSSNDHGDTRYGVYDAGLIGVNRTPSGLAFVRWWMDRSERYSSVDYDTKTQSWPDEQKWLNQVPALFEGTQVLKHAGYNVADWNYNEREISQDGGSHYLANGETLYIKHFHHIDNREKDSAEYVKKHPILSALTKQYTDRLDALGRGRDDSIPWSYQFFASGEPIQPSTRMLYRNNLFLEEKYPNPYELSNEFFEWGMFGEVPPAVQPEVDNKPNSIVAGDTTLSIVRRGSKPPQRSMKKNLKKSKTLSNQVQSHSTSTSSTGKLLVSSRSSVKKQHTWSFPHRRAIPLLHNRTTSRRRVGTR